LPILLLIERQDITYAQGCERWSNDQSGFAEAIATASAADVAVVVVGTWSVSYSSLYRRVVIDLSFFSEIKISSGKALMQRPENT
jgi:hypothetical protein